MKFSGEVLDSIQHHKTKQKQSENTNKQTKTGFQKSESDHRSLTNTMRPWTRPCSYLNKPSPGKWEAGLKNYFSKLSCLLRLLSLAELEKQVGSREASVAEK